MSAYLGIVISFVAFGIGTWLYNRFNHFFLFTPLFVAMILGIGFLVVTGIPYEAYQPGGKVIMFFLEPATIAFAIPLYKQRKLLVKYWKQIAIMLVGGMALSLVSLGIMAKLIHMDNSIIAALLPQPATTAIALPIAESLGGISSITAAAVIFNAVIVSAVGKGLLEWLHIEDPVARGLALGTAGHTIGAAVGLEMGETEGAMASVAMVVVSVLTVFVVPMIAPLFGI
ncbi:MULTISPECIES: antiholin-like protein LrgB [Aerococcus]|uniref:Antiholin-like protein LrgB n=2 Tax=Aerococcus TaxID=1375 RepID=A0A1E9PJ44_9LACT|nr:MULTISPECIES: antiholin-like protein LrgB [Aerococcus]AEA01621.1 putative TIGR00659 family protein [Aerococcus sp. Group 1]KAA9220729.1 antiholin-like protein LrgB [Aerococcus loyolae]KAA9233175.1 antiholin-like protein LrgB [Aerococcus mictus]KAA9265677.1 antiholin-like protein LrgB [Aerococcus loyolae]KAA9292031.1 antiholin-like protein LrgB [Aerococcus mictus]